MILTVIFWIVVIVIAVILLLINAMVIGFLHQSYFYMVSRADFIEDLRNAATSEEAILLMNILK